MVVSILIANYNNGKYIEECLQSILKQTYYNFEIIIVDDCSTDNSIDVINDFLKKDDRIKLFQNDKNEGVGFSKKKCIDLAKGSICGVLDSDDYLTNDAIEIMVKTHNLNPTASIVYSSTIYFNENGIIKGKYRRTSPQPDKVSIIERSNVSHFVTFKRDLYLKSYGVNSFFKGAVDIDLYIVLEEVGNIVHIDKELYYHRMHDTGISQGNRQMGIGYWAFTIKNFHAMRRGFDLKEEYLKDIQYFKYDLSLFSNWMLFRVIIRRCLNKFN